MPFLLKSLEPIWYKWESLGQALYIPQKKLDNITSNQPSCQDNLSNVIKVLGGTIPFKEHTWRKIYEAVRLLDKVNVAEDIEKKHKNLDEPCKLLCLNCNTCTCT